MSRIRIFAIAALCGLFSGPRLSAADLSRYREFGTDLPAVAKQAGIKMPDAKPLHRRPALIQQLRWQLPRVPGPASDGDPVEEIVFGFYNGELFRMVVAYDRSRTAGLTHDDMIEAISATYGTPARPDAEIIFPSIYDESVRVIARWEDSEHSFNLVRSSYQPGYGMVVFSKRLEALAAPAILEAIRLEREEADQTEVDRRKNEEEEQRLRQEKARWVNKPNFRP
jgi:hypothetical protein